jgi:hypothetical protein
MNVFCFFDLDLKISFLSSSSVCTRIGNQVTPFLKTLGLKNATELAACNKVSGASYEGKGSRKSVVVLKVTNNADTKKRIQFVFNDDERLPSKDVQSPQLFFLFHFFFSFLDCLLISLLLCSYC